MSSFLSPENMGPRTISTHPMRPETMSILDSVA